MPITKPDRVAEQAECWSGQSEWRDDVTAEEVQQLSNSVGEISENEVATLTYLVDKVRIVALVVSLFIWTVVGFLFWIPMLFWAITNFSAVVVYATINEADPTRLAGRLERAVRFYLVGFRNVIRAIYAEVKIEEPRNEIQINYGQFTLHAVATIAFWIVVVIAVLAATGRFSFKEIKLGHPVSVQNPANEPPCGPTTVPTTLDAYEIARPFIGPNRALVNRLPC